MAKVGFGGLGIMGNPMAGHLVDAGHTLYLHDIKPVPAEPTGDDGAAWDHVAPVKAPEMIAIHAVAPNA